MIGSSTPGSIRRFWRAAGQNERGRELYNRKTKQSHALDATMSLSLYIGGDRRGANAVRH